MLLEFEFSRLTPYAAQVATIMADSRFATVPEELTSQAVQILEQKLIVLLQDIQAITEVDLQAQDPLQIESIVDRISFAQQYFFEEAFQKSIATYIDLYRLSDVDEEVEAYVKLEGLFDELIRSVHTTLKRFHYTELIATLNTFL